MYSLVPLLLECQLERPLSRSRGNVGCTYKNAGASVLRKNRECQRRKMERHFFVAWVEKNDKRKEGRCLGGLPKRAALWEAPSQRQKL